MSNIAYRNMRYLKNMKTTNIGFTATESSDNPQPTIEDFCEKAQMPDEFMGRFPIIIKLKLNNVKIC